MLSQADHRNSSRHLRKCLLRASLCLLLAGAGAFAQSTPEGNADLPVAAPPAAAQDLTSLSMEELLGLKVYSASRHLESSQEAPAAVTVLTADEIAAYGWRTLADALNSA